MRILRLCSVWCLFFMSVNGMTVEASRKQDVVSLVNGEISGLDQGTYIAYKGIPYAAPPVGNNRWRAPQPVEPWEHVLDASVYANDCAQLPFPSDAAPLGEEPAEDCLYVNVWSPKGAAKKRPVVLWVYGGGFVNGGSSPAVYSGAKFAEQGVVFVSFNYRVGRFGFFAHPALTAANEGPLANYALMDQLAALDWINKNISAFNGDPENITLMGESAGGRSVLQLLTSDSATGKFQKAIVMSGGGRDAKNELHLQQLQDGQVRAKSAEQIGMNFAKSKGIDGQDSDALTALRSLPEKEVVDGLNLMAYFKPDNGPVKFIGRPVTEGTIVKGSVEALLQAGKVAKVPVMIGTTSQDIGFNAFKNKKALFESFGVDNERAKKAYDPSGNMMLGQLGTNVSQDQRMQEPARFVSKALTEQDLPVYLYRFSYVAESIRDGKTGAQHASEVPFFFNTVEQKYAGKVTLKDKKMANTIQDYLVNFIANGTPNGGDLPKWQVFDPVINNLMDFSMNDGPRHGPDPWKSRLDVIETNYSAK